MATDCKLRIGTDILITKVVTTFRYFQFWVEIKNHSSKLWLHFAVGIFRICFFEIIWSWILMFFLQILLYIFLIFFKSPTLKKYSIVFCHIEPAKNYSFIFLRHLSQTDPIILNTLYLWPGSKVWMRAHKRTFKPPRRKSQIQSIQDYGVVC